MARPPRSLRPTVGRAARRGGLTASTGPPPRRPAAKNEDFAVKALNDVMAVRYKENHLTMLWRLPPTQVIAESFKSRGHDGILYRSALGTGVNVALFNLDVAKLVACYLYQVTSVKFETKQVRHPYIVAR